MLDWPQLDELKQVLDVESLDWDGDRDQTRLTRLLEAAIARVKADVGDWDEYSDVPDEALSQAALRMAELMALKPEVLAGMGTPRSSRVAASFVGDPTYLNLLYGHRRSFGIA